MKLESLKNDKFASFKSNEIQNALNIVGGKCWATCRGNTDDYYTDATATPGLKNGAGTPLDFVKGTCTSVQ
jgi:hypothetical protein